jgi:hypothetical protein
MRALLGRRTAVLILSAVIGRRAGSCGRHRGTARTRRARLARQSDLADYRLLRPAPPIHRVCLSLVVVSGK